METLDPHSLVIVGQYTSLADADLAVSILEAAGIPSVLTDEYTVGIYWLYSNAIGGVKVKVRASDEKQALALLHTEIQDSEIAS